MDIQIVSQEFYEYSKSIRGYSKDTIRRYNNVIRGFMKFTGVTTLESITEKKVYELFYYGRLERHWTVRTYLVYQFSLKVFFEWCVKQGYMEINPLLVIEKPKIPKQLPKGLSKEKAFKVLEAAENYPRDSRLLRYRNHAILATLIYAGLRKQELLNLKYCDVDLEGLIISIRLGKGSKDRLIPITYALAHSLKRYVAIRNQSGKTCPEFFVSTRDNSGFSSTGLRRLICKTSKAISSNFSAHKLRHTFATLLVEGGCDIYSLSKMMGHSDIRTTTIYLSATAEHLRLQISKHPLNSNVA